MLKKNRDNTFILSLTKEIQIQKFFERVPKSKIGIDHNKLILKQDRNTTLW